MASSDWKGKICILLYLISLSNIDYTEPGTFNFQSSGLIIILLRGQKDAPKYTDIQVIAVVKIKSSKINKDRF